MLTSGELYEKLMPASRRYTELKVRFAEFSGLLEDLFTRGYFNVKGLAVKRDPEADHIDIVFVGRTFRLVFSAAMTEQPANLVGVVSCYGVVEYPEKKLVPIGSFTFKPDGKSDIKAPPDNDPLYINVDAAAIYIVLHLIHEGLAK